MRKPLYAMASCALVLAATAASAGPVDVSFVESTRFSDAGTTRWDEEGNLKTLATHLQTLGQRYLAPGQTLKVEVLDVDLAGMSYPTSRGNIRVARGRADLPRITLRYSLQGGDQVLRQGEETVTDLDYMNHIRDASENESLRHEKRMLTQWFQARFAPARPRG
ncbi:DUF3016 domain-containing protein [Ideonella sp. BN130291]|uniref:DUF3016 domain-containing protein n=1 Tax=Ideonella sp. BN130291 TaxID=3112940 RepID=UPI002E25D374|nr:DUF3016 domain-containing protein [Ideonella sp. BN130291]